MKRILTRIWPIVAMLLLLFSACKKKPASTGSGDRGSGSQAASQSAQPAGTPNPALKAREEAVRLYPELAKKDSLFNRTFRALYEDRKKTDPQMLTQDNWPLLLAARVGEILQVKPVKRK